MEKYSRVLQRVEDDLARGHTHVALQRLSTLIQEDPQSLDLRARLAEVHLRTGNLVEAGRWSFVLPTPQEEAVQAFERAYPDPRARLRHLRWSSDGSVGLSASGRDRLRQLETEARTRPARGRSRGSQLHTRSVRMRAQDAAFRGIVLAFIVLAVIGLVTAIRWIG